MSPEETAINWLRNETQRWMLYGDDMPGKNTVLALMLRFEIETGILLSTGVDI